MNSRKRKFPKYRLVVTGASGFVGRVLMERLKAGDFADVRVIRSNQYDLRRAEDADAALAGSDVVVHIAGITGGIEFTKKNQGFIYHDNILMNTNVLHYAWVHNAKKVISVGTVCSYPKFARTPFKEDEIWEGYPEEVNAHYGMAKKMLIVQGDAYRNQYGLRSQVLLFTNLYGPGDHFEATRSHVIPALVVKFCDASAKGNERVTLWGDGSPTRDFLYVTDAADALLAAIYAEADVPVVNIGSGREVSIRRLAGLIRDHCDRSIEIEWDTTRPNGQPRRVLDIARAGEALGFEPKVGLEEGLEKTIAWYRNSRIFLSRTRRAASTMTREET